jgi:hypothetical protein
VDLSKLSTSDRLIAGGGVVYLIAMFLPWYGLSGGANNGWDYFLGGVIPLLLILVSAGKVLMTAMAPDSKLPDLPMPWSQVHLIAGAAAAVLVLLRLIIGSDIDAGFVSISLDRKYGLFLALLSAAAVAAGGLLKFQEGDAPSVGGAGPGSAPF